MRRRDTVGGGGPVDTREITWNLVDGQLLILRAPSGQLGVWRILPPSFAGDGKIARGEIKGATAPTEFISSAVIRARLDSIIISLKLILELLKTQRVP